MSLDDPMSDSAGKRFRAALAIEKPLQIAGALNAITALMATKIGFRAIYLSGAGVANASFALPDLGLTTFSEVLEDARRITASVETPLLVDVDTGFGSPLMVQRVVKQLIRADVAAMHIEDQESDKRCGHREGKKLVSKEIMAAKIKAAADARNQDFVIIARTDALSVEGLEKTIERAQLYADAGADLIFAEAFQTLEQYKTLHKHLTIPILANQTEFGKTPFFSLEDWKNTGVAAVLYPLTAARAMYQAAWQTLLTLRNEGTQINILDQLQKREELYSLLDYERIEKEQEKWSI